MLQIKLIPSKINNEKWNKKNEIVFFLTFQIGDFTFFISKYLSN